jgi:hypothetical protein
VHLTLQVIQSLSYYIHLDRGDQDLERYAAEAERAATAIRRRAALHCAESLRAECSA